jgi:hypothetical protein
LRVSVNQDEFSVNNILRLFAIYLELEDTKAREYFFVNRLKYSLNNLSLKTLESDSTTQSELDDIFVNVSKLSDNEFVDSFMTLQNKIPSQIFKNYVNRNKDRLEKILGKGDKLIPTIY